MKDFPFFNTESGIASLTLKEIPYTKAAYIKILDASEPEKLLEECVAFCKIAGAEQIFGSNHQILEKYPLHTKILQMSAQREGLEDTDAALFPVTEQTIDLWCDIYNKRMREISNFSYMSDKDGKALLEKGNGYFIHRESSLLGIGIASGNKIDGIVAVLPGAGKDVLLALNHALSGDSAMLEVASTNLKAMCLYKRLGFIINCEISSWYRIL